MYQRLAINSTIPVTKFPLGDAVERANGELFLQQYKTITNLNQMLAYMENGVLSSREYALYKGEALGLRAYLHFDLIRLYGPMPMNVQEGRRYLPYELLSVYQRLAINSTIPVTKFPLGA